MDEEWMQSNGLWRTVSLGQGRMVAIADISGSADQTGPGRGLARVGEGPPKFRDGGDSLGLNEAVMFEERK